MEDSNYVLQYIRKLRVQQTDWSLRWLGNDLNKFASSCILDSYYQVSIALFAFQSVKNKQQKEKLCEEEIRLVEKSNLSASKAMGIPCKREKVDHCFPLLLVVMFVVFNSYDKGFWKVCNIVPDIVNWKLGS